MLRHRAFGPFRGGAGIQGRGAVQIARRLRLPGLLHRRGCGHFGPVTISTASASVRIPVRIALS